MIKLVDHFWPEKPAHSSAVLSPTWDIFWIRPHEITEGSFSGYFLLPIEFSNLIESVDLRWESSMYTEDLILILTEVLSMTAESGKKSKV